MSTQVDMINQMKQDLTPSFDEQEMDDQLSFNKRKRLEEDIKEEENETKKRKIQEEEKLETVYEIEEGEHYKYTQFMKSMHLFDVMKLKKDYVGKGQQKCPVIGIGFPSNRRDKNGNVILSNRFVIGLLKQDVDFENGMLCRDGIFPKIPYEELTDEEKSRVNENYKKYLEKIKENNPEANPKSDKIPAKFLPSVYTNEPLKEEKGYYMRLDIENREDIIKFFEKLEKVINDKLYKKKYLWNSKLKKDMMTNYHRNLTSEIQNASIHLMTLMKSKETKESKDLKKKKKTKKPKNPLSELIKKLDTLKQNSELNSFEPIENEFIEICKEIPSYIDQLEEEIEEKNVENILKEKIERLKRKSFDDVNRAPIVSPKTLMKIDDKGNEIYYARNFNLKIYPGHKMYRKALIRCEENNKNKNEEEEEEEPEQNETKRYGLMFCDVVKRKKKQKKDESFDFEYLDTIGDLELVKPGVNIIPGIEINYLTFSSQGISIVLKIRSAIVDENKYTETVVKVNQFSKSSFMKGKKIRKVSKKEIEEIEQKENDLMNQQQQHEENQMEIDNQDSNDENKKNPSSDKSKKDDDGEEEEENYEEYYQAYE